MDAKRFDAATKTIASTGSDRRTVLRRLAGGALGLMIGGSALNKAALGQSDYCIRGVAGRKKNCCHREGDACRTTHQCCRGRCEQIDGTMQCGACFNIGAPCEEGADCCTFICARRSAGGGKICANA